MTSKEFVSYMKGVFVTAKERPTKEQWEQIKKILMDVNDLDVKFYSEEKWDVQKGKWDVQKGKRDFPGSPPDVFM